MAYLLLQHLFISLIICSALGQERPAHEIESSIYNEIFNDRKYNKLFRPLDHTVITFGLSLASIIDLFLIEKNQADNQPLILSSLFYTHTVLENEKEGYITTTFLSKMSWYERRLAWNDTSDRFRGVRYIQIPSSLIWLPDLELFNRFKDTAHDSSMEPLAFIHSDGLVVYVPRRTYQTPCSFDLENFPYDSQTCQLVFGSWAYTRTQVDFHLMHNRTDLAFFVGHSDFFLESADIQRIETHYGSPDYPYVELVSTIHLSRRTKFFYYMYMVPADLMLFLIPVVHLLPPNADSKLGLLSAILISTVLMLNVLEDFLPGYYSPSPPKPLRLYFSCLVSVLFSAIVSCISLSVSNVATKASRIPLICRRFLDSKLANICCLCSQGAGPDYQLLHLGMSMSARRSDDREILTEAGPQDDTEATERERSNTAEASSSKIETALQSLIDEMQYARYRDQLGIEWMQLARFIDRIAAIIFTISALLLLSINHR